MHRQVLTDPATPHLACHTRPRLTNPNVDTPSQPSWTKPFLYSNCIASPAMTRSRRILSRLDPPRRACHVSPDHAVTNPAPTFRDSPCPACRDQPLAARTRRAMRRRPYQAQPNNTESHQAGRCVTCPTLPNPTPPQHAETILSTRRLPCRATTCLVFPTMTRNACLDTSPRVAPHVERRAPPGREQPAVFCCAS